MKRFILIVMVTILGVVSAAAQDVIVKRNGEAVGQVLMCVASAGALAIEICSIVDAVRMAKVKNMYENDLRRKYSFDMKIYPSVGCVRSADGLQPAPGMTLAFRF